MGKRLLKPQAGDVFTIPLPDGDLAVGQVVASLPEMGVVGCAFFAHKLVPGSPVPMLTEPTCVQVITPDLLERRYWPIVETRPVLVPSTQFHWETHREANWVGVKIIGSGIMREFVHAFHGFLPWDTMADPEYFTKLLVAGRSKPSTAYVAGG